jgi:cytochrome c-type biogenesis protein
MVNPTFIVAFIGGVVSFISPCMLPLVPVYLGYLGGQISHTTHTPTPHRHWRVLLHSLIFVLGFTVVFVVIGLFSTVFLERISGDDLNAAANLIGRMGGVIAVVFGLHFTGILPSLIKRLDTVPAVRSFAAASNRLFYGSVRWQPRVKTVGSFSSSVLLGMALAAGWTPCIGPVYGTILTIGLNDGRVEQVAWLMVIYSLGLGLPFVLTALMLDGASGVLARLKRGMRAVEIGSGVFLIVLGIALFTGQLQSASRRFANQFADISIAVEENALEFFTSEPEQ